MEEFRTKGVVATSRIHAFNTEDEWDGFTMTCEFLGYQGDYIGFKTTTFDPLDRKTSTGHCFKKVRSQDDFQTAETVATSRALAFLGIQSEDGIAGWEELNEGITTPSEEPVDANIMDVLKSGRKG